MVVLPSDPMDLSVDALRQCFRLVFLEMNGLGIPDGMNERERERLEGLRSAVASLRRAVDDFLEAIGAAYDDRTAKRVLFIRKED